MAKKRMITINSDKDEKASEEDKQSTKAFMPNLPKPLTIEEKKYLLAVERGNNNIVQKMLQKSHRHPSYMNKDCVDPMGRGAFHMAIDNENLEMVELLVVMGVETKDALLHAIDVEFVEAVEVLLDHEELIHKEGELYSWEKVDRQTTFFTPEITPLILAAHRNNYEILKILLDRGAMLPMSHDIRCGCEECIKFSSEDSLRHSLSRINCYRALASPSLIALSSTDPILTAFELSWELKTLAYDEQEFRQEYLELRRQCRDFAEELLDHTRSSTELAVILNYDPESLPYEEGEHMELRRLQLAIDYKQKKFVAHANVQQLLAAIWYEGLPGFRRKSVVGRLMEIVKVVVFFPFYCMYYMVKPESPTGKLMRTPFMKFLIHSSSYLFFLLLLILVSVRFEDLIVYLFGTESMRKQLEESSRRQRGNLPTPIEFFVFFYVFGFIWEDILEINSEGIHKYMRNMWNILAVMRDSLYISTILLRIGAYMQQNFEIRRDPRIAYIPKEEWGTFDPQLISEGLFSAANILSALKLVHIFSISPYLGPLQISLRRMVIDIVKFFFIYTLVLFAFACGLTQLLWYYNDLEKNKCYSLPGGLPDWTKQGNACMKWRKFHNVFEASQSLFWAGFGMVGLSDFELTGIREYTRFWSMLMFGTYSVINIIVLLNLLIAMMSSSYSFIVDHADTEWKFARTKLWMSYFEEGKTLPPPFNILPNIRHFRKYLEKKEGSGKMRRMSTRAQHIKRKVRDYRYLGVMRALIWRYICSLQKRNVDNPITEDDINEVKGDISSLRFELIDLLKNNGMDVSACPKKSKGTSAAALGRKMRMWERQLMRDFHVSPAMGSEEVTSSPAVEEPQKERANFSAADRFRRIIKLAMTSKVADIASAATGKNLASQIGRAYQDDDAGRENLKKVMERVRRKMEKDTPDSSPTSSRGYSPYPDLYTGPHLLDTINSLQLSPTASTAPTPMPLDVISKLDDQANDPNLLTISGRRSSKSLDKGDPGGEMSLSVSSEVFSVNTFKALSQVKSRRNPPTEKKETSEEKKKKSKTETEPNITKESPVTVFSVSEKDSSLLKKTDNKTQHKESETPKTEYLAAKESKAEIKNPSKDVSKFSPEDVKLAANKLLKDTSNEILKSKKTESSKMPTSDAMKKPVISAKQEDSKPLPQLGPKDAALFKTGNLLQPSLVRIQISQMLITKQPEAKRDPVRPPALRLDPKICRVVESFSSSISRPRPQCIIPYSNIPGAKVAPPVAHSFKQPPEQTELQNTNIVRRPRVLPTQGSQDKLNEEKSSPPEIPKSVNLASTKFSAETRENAKEPTSKQTILPAISIIPSTPPGLDIPFEKNPQMILTTKQDFREKLISGDDSEIETFKEAQVVEKEPTKSQVSSLQDQPTREVSVPKIMKEEVNQPKAEPLTKNKELFQPPHMVKESSKEKLLLKPFTEAFIPEMEMDKQKAETSKEISAPEPPKIAESAEEKSSAEASKEKQVPETVKPKEKRQEADEEKKVTPTQTKKGGWL